MSAHKFIRVGTAPFRWTNRNPSIPSKLVGDGPAVWMLTADQEPVLGIDLARRERPPMTLVARFLEALEGKGYHVVASHSVAFGEQGHQMTHIWTLKHAPASQITA